MPLDGRRRQSLKELVEAAREDTASIVEGFGKVSGNQNALLSSRSQVGKAAGYGKLVEVAEELGVQDNDTIKLANLLMRRVVKATKNKSNVPEESLHQWKRLLHSVLDNKRDTGEKVETFLFKHVTPSGTRPLPPCKPSLRDFFPTRYHLQVALRRTPAPPSRSAGKGFGTNQIFCLILGFLDAHSLVHCCSISKGLVTFFHEELQESSSLWGRLAGFHFGILGTLDLSMTTFQRLWRNHKLASVLMFGEVHHAEELVRHDLVGVFQTIVVDRALPVVPVTIKQYHIAQAIFLAAKALSPCIIFFRENCLDHTVQESNCRTRLKRQDIDELCQLVRCDTSNDPIVVACCSRTPWMIQKRMLNNFGSCIGFIESSSWQPRSNPQAFLAFLRHHSIAIDPIAEDLESHLSKANCLLDPRSFPLLLDLATGRLLHRMRSCTSFRLEHGKYIMSTADVREETQHVTLSQLPIDKVHYGPFELEDFLFALRRFRAVQAHDMQASLHNSANKDYYRRLQEWSCTF